jgi:exosortase
MDLPVAGTERFRNFAQAGLWLLPLAFAVVALPTVQTLSGQRWVSDSDGQGPIILATGAWLLWRQLADMAKRAEPARFWLTLLMLAAALVGYIFGRAYDYITLEAGGVYGVGLAVLHQKFGLKALLANWFPLLYLAFVIPLPGSILNDITIPLKQFVSYIATSGLHALGFPVAREGVVISVAQYQLLMEDACSGLNSIEGLIAVGLLYVYLVRGSSIRYSLILTAFVIPIAVLANVIRVSILVLLTYFFGDQVAQSFIHFAAGMVLFGTALLLVFATDNLIHNIMSRRAAKTGAAA